jgi:GT2 family glycosyltransferase
MRRDGRVGVVVLTHDRTEELLCTVRHLLALPERPRVVVVDNASADDTSGRLAVQAPAVTAIRLPANVGAAARNVGVRRLDTPYVALCDDDTWWATGALARAADLLDAYPRLAVVSGRVLVGPEEREDPTCAVMAASPLPDDLTLPGRPLLGFMAGAAVVRRSAFLAAGGFDRRLFLGGEELLLALDLATAGWGMAYAADVAVHHHPSPRRDPVARRRLTVRNALWCAWLRRPWAGALSGTLQVLATRPRDAAWRAGVSAAVAGLPWVLHERRPVPARVEAALRTVEAGRPGRSGSGCQAAESRSARPRPYACSL